MPLPFSYNTDPGHGYDLLEVVREQLFGHARMREGKVLEEPYV